MENAILKFIIDAPADRLAVIMAVFFIGLMAVAIKQLWCRCRTLETELTAMHALQRDFVGRVVGALGGKQYE